MSRNLLKDWQSNPDAFDGDCDRNLVNRLRRKPHPRFTSRPQPLPTRPPMKGPKHEEHKPAGQ